MEHKHYFRLKHNEYSPNPKQQAFTGYEWQNCECGLSPKEHIEQNSYLQKALKVG